MKSICLNRTAGWASWVLGAVAACSAHSALAWGADGHRAIGAAAYQELKPAVRARVDRILSVEPGATLASIATWADEHRSPRTAKWHYVNISAPNCHYVPEVDCPEGQCVVAAIPREVAALRESRDPEDTLKALKYVVHLVGDAHQPLHAGRALDKGGNTYQIHAWGRGTNLHALWDSGMIRHDPELLDGLSRVRVKGVADLNPSDWAEASCRMASEPGFYPAGHKVSDEYEAAHEEELRDQLALAAAHLAGVLNAALR